MPALLADLHTDSVIRPATLGIPLCAPYQASSAAARLRVTACFPGSGREPRTTRRARLFQMLDTLDGAVREEMLFPVRSAADLAAFSVCGGDAVLFAVEGGGFFLRDLPLLFTRGVRILSLVWDKNEFGASSRESGTREDTGLSALGRKAVSLCERLGILVDTSHLSDNSFRDVAANTARPLLATHSNFRAVCPHPRNLTDEAAALIAARGGLIGLNLYPPFLSSARGATLDDLLFHVEHGLSLCGDGTLALGTDMDGTGGEYPRGVSLSDSVYDRVADALLCRYSATVVSRIVGENARKFLQNRLPMGDSK